MRRPLIACVRTADTLLGTRLSYTLVNGVRVPSDAQLGQPYAAPLSSGNEDGGTFTVTGTVPPGMRVPYQHGATHTSLGGRPRSRARSPSPRRAPAARARRGWRQARQPPRR